MRENLLKKQPTWGLRRAQGTGQKSATPATLTKVILVLLTTFLLPSASWGVDEYTLGSGETLTYNNGSSQYSSRKGLVWNVTLTNIPNSNTVPKYDNGNFIHFCELRLTSSIPYKGKMTGFSFSGTVSTINDDGVQNPDVDQILVYKSSSASDFSGRTLIGVITKSGSNYTYASQSSDPLNNDYIQVVFYRENVNLNQTFSANKITNITMTFEGTSYGIKVGNQRVTSNNYDDIFKDGGKVSYNSADNTLTLNGATIDGCIRYSGTNGLNIQFEGNNTITAVDSAAIWTVYDSTPSQLPSLVLSGSGNAKLSSGSYVGYSAIAGFSQINGGLSAAYLEDYTGADFTSLTGGKDIIICNGSPYGFYVGGTIVTASNKATVLGSGVDFTPATSDVATLTFSDKATIPGELEWDINNALKIQLSGANAVQGCIHSNKDVALSFSYPSGTNNSSLTFGNSAGTQSAISGFTEVTFPDINSPGDNKLSFDENVSYNTSDKALKNDKNEVVTSSHISYYYGLTIAGVAVTSTNVDSDGKITGIGGVKFTAPATLTLEDAEIISYTSGNALETEIDNLIIELKGNNMIATDEGNYALFGNGNNKITLSSNQEGSLTLENNYNSGGGLVKNITIDKSDDLTLTILEPTTVTTIEEAIKAIYTKGTPLGLTVNNVIVTTNNKDNIQEGVSFDSENNKLVLTKATIDGSVVWDTDDDLYIEINGENSIGEILATTGTSNIIHFTEGNSTGDKTVVISEIISGFDGFPDLGTSLYNIESGSNYATITTAAYDLKVFVNGKLIQVQKYSSDYPGYKDNIKGEATATVTFDGDHTLTLNQVTITENTSGDNSHTSIVSGLNNLTIKLLGDGYYSSTIEGKIKSTNSDAKLTFTSEDNGSLFIGNGDPIEGFKGNPSFENGLVYLPYGSSEGVNIKKLNIPYMGLVDGNLELNGYEDEWNVIKCAYTIEYTDGTKETGEYNPDQPKAINKPCVVTAHAVYQDKFGTTNTGDDAVGKYFGAKQEVFTVAIGDKIEGTSWFTPEIVTGEDGDNISCEFKIQENDESSIFEMETIGSESYLVARKPGTTDINAFLWWSSEGTTVLNDSDEPITLTINVGEKLTSYFGANNNYGTFYNTSTTTYAVPEGMKAYVITGADPETGKVTTAETTVLPPNTPVLLEKGSAKAFNYIPAISGTAPSGNILLYTGKTDVQATEGSNLYVLYNDKFVKVTTDTRILSQKCYLKLNTSSSGTRSYYDIDGSDGTTALREVKSEGVKGEKWNDGEWYTLQGQRVTKPTKPGLYILNGKKVVIK